MKKHGRFSAKRKTKDVDGRIEKKKRLTASVYARKKKWKCDYYRLQHVFFFFFLYVGINPTLIKRLRYYILTIMFDLQVFHTESAHPTGSNVSPII